MDGGGVSTAVGPLRPPPDRGLLISRLLAGAASATAFIFLVVAFRYERLALGDDVVLALRMAVVAVFVGAAAIVAGRRSDDRIALLSAITLCCFGVAFGTAGADAVAPHTIGLQLVASLLNWLAFSCVALFCATFPDGRFVPAWSRWPTVGWLLFSGVLVTPGLSQAFRQTPVFPVAALVLWTSLLAAQIVRYRRYSTAVARQQTKVVVFGLTATLSLAVAAQLVEVAGVVTGGLALTIVSDVVLTIVPTVLLLRLCQGSRPDRPAGACTASYTTASQWQGESQGEVTMRAGAGGISSWTAR